MININLINASYNDLRQNINDFILNKDEFKNLTHNENILMQSTEQIFDFNFEEYKIYNKNNCNEYFKIYYDIEFMFVK